MVRMGYVLGPEGRMRDVGADADVVLDAAAAGLIDGPDGLWIEMISLPLMQRVHWTGHRHHHQHCSAPTSCCLHPHPALHQLQPCGPLVWPASVLCHAQCERGLPCGAEELVTRLYDHVTVMAEPSLLLMWLYRVSAEVRTLSPCEHAPGHHLHLQQAGTESSRRH